MPFDGSEQNREWARKGARKPYALEQKHLETMRRIVSKDLKMVEELQSKDNLNAVEKEKLMILQGRVFKYLDKLHIPKEQIEITGKDDGPIEINQKTIEISKKYEEELNKLEDGGN